MRLTLTQEADSLFYVHIGGDTGVILGVFTTVRAAVAFMREYQS